MYVSGISNHITIYFSSIHIHISIHRSSIVMVVGSIYHCPSSSAKLFNVLSIHHAMHVCIHYPFIYLLSTIIIRTSQHLFVIDASMYSVSSTYAHHNISIFLINTYSSIGPSSIINMRMNRFPVNDLAHIYACHHRALLSLVPNPWSTRRHHLTLLYLIHLSLINSLGSTFHHQSLSPVVSVC